MRNVCRIFGRLPNTKQSDLFARPADLVVEGRHADLLKEVALRIVERSDLLLFSITALADEAFRTALEETAIKCGRKVFLRMEPSSASMVWRTLGQLSNRLP